MEFFLITDQPSICPKCGARTDVFSDFYHTNLRMWVNVCLNSDCKHVHLEVEPDSQ